MDAPVELTDIERLHRVRAGKQPATIEHGALRTRTSL
jgi:hypothetical protein